MHMISGYDYLMGSSLPKETADDVVLTLLTAYRLIIMGWGIVYHIIRSQWLSRILTILHAMSMG